MPVNITTTGIAAPGWKGLNLQGAGGLLPPEWCTVATNFVFDNSGRLASRKGWAKQSTTDVGTKIEQVYEYINAAGVGQRVFATADNLYKETGGTTTSIEGAIAVSNGNWKFQNWNDGANQLVLGLNNNSTGSKYIQWDGGGGAAVAVTLTGATPAPSGSDMIVAWGRVWGLDANDTVVKYSKALDHTDFTNTGSGVINLYNVFGEGMDRAVALAQFNGQLVIFGRNNILIYGGASTALLTDWVDPTSSDFTLVDHIQGYGCIARDSIQNTGGDLLFLSAGGVQSLGRLIQERSAPQREETVNVRDTLITDISGQADKTKIRSTYNEEEGFYLLCLPDTTPAKIYCLDMRGSLETGGRRVTIWEDLNPTAFHTSRLDTKTLYMANEVNGTEYYLSTYSGTDDNGSKIALDYESGWLVLNEDPQAAHRYVVPKKLTGVFTTAETNVINFKWAFDFTPVFKTANYTLAGAEGSKYGVAKWAVDTYSGGVSILDSRIGMRGFGEHIKYGFKISTGSTFAASKLELHSKLGRIHG